MTVATLKLAVPACAKPCQTTIPISSDWRLIADVYCWTLQRRGEVRKNRRSGVYWVRDEQIKKRLRAKGCTLPIYVLGELRAVAGFDVKTLRRLHKFKREFDAVIHPPNAN